MARHLLQWLLMSYFCIQESFAQLTDETKQKLQSIIQEEMPFCNPLNLGDDTTVDRYFALNCLLIAMTHDALLYPHTYAIARIEMAQRVMVAINKHPRRDGYRFH